jgi:hypothetical protein
MSIYKLPLPTDTWLINKLINISSEGYTIIAKLHEKKDVIIKLSLDNPDSKGGNNEYFIYKFIEKLHLIPTIPRIYGVMNCYEKNVNIKNNLQNLVDKGLCNGLKNDDSSKIYFTIIKRINNSFNFSEYKQLPKHYYLSILVQGLYTIYNLFYIFGILHNDFNDGNILLKPCDPNEKIVFKFDYIQYRYFSHEIDLSKDNYSYKYEIETNGVLLYIIDFDQATIYHHNYINTGALNKHPIQNAYDFINTIFKYEDGTLYNICKDHYDTRGEHLIKASQKFIDRYNIEKTEINSYYLIDKLRSHYRMWIKELFNKIDDLKNKGYGEFC